MHQSRIRKRYISLSHLNKLKDKFNPTAIILAREPGLLWGRLTARSSLPQFRTFANRSGRFAHHETFGQVLPGDPAEVIL
jgi:hypothetical protein